MLKFPALLLRDRAAEHPREAPDVERPDFGDARRPEVGLRPVAGRVGAEMADVDRAERPSGHRKLGDLEECRHNQECCDQ